MMHENGASTMTDDAPWLNVPQAVVLEATHDVEFALNLTAETLALLQIKASRRLARSPVIAPEAVADTEQWADARKRFEVAKAILQPDYLEAEHQLNRRLAAGVRTKARRTPGGPYENVDPIEYIGTELRGFDAIDKMTRSVRLFDILINAFDHIEHVTGKPIWPARAASSPAPDQIEQHFSPEGEKWECMGDPVPKLVDWARSRWGEDLQKLPNRGELLRLFREQFGRVFGINEKTMRAVRRQLATAESRQGGARMQRRYL
jgi:hypothetical protein